MEVKSPLFHVTYRLTQENPQNSSSEEKPLNLFDSSTLLSLYTSAKDGKQLSDYLSKVIKLPITTNEDYSCITILPVHFRGLINFSGISVPFKANETTDSSYATICNIHFSDAESAYQFTQHVSLQDDKGQMLIYYLTGALLTLMPFNPISIYQVASHSEEKQKPIFEKITQQPVADLFANTALEKAINDLNKILSENECAENSYIYHNALLLKTQLSSFPDRKTRLSAIRNFERACKIDLGTKIGQAIALVIVAAVAFTLGVVIGEAMGIPSGAWNDITSAMLKILETFNGTLTTAALAVLGGATLACVAAPTITYYAFFKPDEITKAAEKVASEAKSFVK